MESILGPQGWANPEALGEEKQLSLLDARKDITTWRQPHFWQSALSSFTSGSRSVENTDTARFPSANRSGQYCGIREKNGKGKGGTETTRKSASK